MALSLNETKKKRKRDRGGKGYQNQIDAMIDEVADTGVPSEESVLDAVADSAAGIMESAAKVVETVVEENPFVAPWSSEALKSEPAQERSSTRATSTSAHSAKTHPSPEPREAAHQAQSLSDFYMRMNPMAVQLSLLRAGFSWGEACYEANRQMVETAQTAFSEMMKIWSTPFRRK